MATKATVRCPAAVTGHRFAADNGVEFLVTWNNQSQPEWVGAKDLLETCCDPWISYVESCGLSIAIEE